MDLVISTMIFLSVMFWTLDGGDREKEGSLRTAARLACQAALAAAAGLMLYSSHAGLGGWRGAALALRGHLLGARVWLAARGWVTLPPPQVEGYSLDLVVPGGSRPQRRALEYFYWRKAHEGEVRAIRGDETDWKIWQGETGQSRVPPHLVVLTKPGHPSTYLRVGLAALEELPQGQPDAKIFGS